MRWRVPEVALVLSDRAVALAGRTGDRVSRLSAEALAVFASNRLGRGVPATGRALAAVREAETAGDPELLSRLRIELAWCAGSSGSYEVASRILHPELERERIEPGLRAHALLALAAALPTRRDVDERARVIDEAERLYASCASNRDVTRLLTARVFAARAGHLRRLSAFGEAVAAADSGQELLDALTDADADGGGIRARLELERVQALLDLGRRVEAVESARGALARPVRAAEAGPVGWLGLALATRVHLPAGDHASAVRLLGDTVAVAERHELDGLLVETLNILSRAHENAADGKAALGTLREAYSADRRWRSRVHEARMSLLTEFPPETAKRSAPNRPLTAVAPEPPAPEPPAPAAPPAPEPRVVGTPRRRRRAEPMPEAVAPEPVPVPETVPEQVEPQAEAVESIETDWAAFLGLASDGESGTEPEPVEQDSAEPEPVEQAVAEVDPSVLHGFAETQDAARRLLETLTSRAERAEDPDPERTEPAEPEAAEPERAEPEPAEPTLAEPTLADPEPADPEPADPEPVEPERTAWVEDALPEPRVEFAGLSDDPPWSTISPGGHAEDGRGRERDPLASAADSLRWITEAGPGHGVRGEDDGLPPEDDELPGVVDDEPAQVTGEPRATATSLLEQVGLNLASYGAAATQSPETGAAETGAAETEITASEPAEETSGGRRSRGKSLAEIRAELDLPADHQPSRRRRRAEEPGPEPVSAQPEPARPEPETAPEPVAEPSADAGLADLLAEAMKAYEVGSRHGGAARGGAQHGASVAEEPVDDPVQSTSDDQRARSRARHREGSFDTAATDPLR